VENGAGRVGERMRVHAAGGFAGLLGRRHGEGEAAQGGETVANAQGHHLAKIEIPNVVSSTAGPTYQPTYGEQPLALGSLSFVDSVDFGCRKPLSILWILWFLVV
jgi:hypothetical protein